MIRKKHPVAKATIVPLEIRDLPTNPTPTEAHATILQATEFLKDFPGMDSRIYWDVVQQTLAYIVKTHTNVLEVAETLFAAYGKKKGRKIYRRHFLHCMGVVMEKCTWLNEVSYSFVQSSLEQTVPSGDSKITMVELGKGHAILDGGTIRSILTQMLRTSNDSPSRSEPLDRLRNENKKLTDKDWSKLASLFKRQGVHRA